MPITCPECSSDQLVLDSNASSGPNGIPTRCETCGHHWVRRPRTPCPRCGSLEIDDVGIHESWAYDDPEAARDNPTTATWSYLDKVNHSCLKCHHTWSTVHSASPHAPDGGASPA